MRKATNRLYDMIDEGRVSLQQVVDMCLGAMSEDDVAEMMDNNELSERFDEEPEDEDDEDESDPMNDVNYVGHPCHY